MTTTKKPIAFIIFYILLGYVLIQFSWWTYLLINLYVESGAEASSNKIAMILGEGAVFLILLLTGAYFTLKSLKKEIALAQRQKNFLLSITHELKSPLAAIKLNSETTLKHDLSKEQTNSLAASSLKNSDRLHFLVENLLLASGIDNERHQGVITFVNLNSLINGIISQRFSLSTERISVVISGTDSVETDEQAIAFILINLMDNALKYSPSNSTIEVKGLKNSSGYIVEVIDNGETIPVDERKVIFEQFYRRGNEMTRSTKGTGIGLYIVKQLARQLNIEIELLENKPSGNVFKLLFKN